MLISNGLGTPHHAWPDINRRTDTYRVMTWDHRGLGGSERPSDESRINISDHTDDLFAVMDSYGIDRAVSPGQHHAVRHEPAHRRVGRRLDLIRPPGQKCRDHMHRLISQRNDRGQRKVRVGLSFPMTW